MGVTTRTYTSVSKTAPSTVPTARPKAARPRSIAARAAADASDTAPTAPEMAHTTYAAVSWWRQKRRAPTVAPTASLIKAERAPALRLGRWRGGTTPRS